LNFLRSRLRLYSQRHDFLHPPVGKIINRAIVVESRGDVESPSLARLSLSVCGTMEANLTERTSLIATSGRCV
jgi:hypothetical protein